MKQHTSDRFCCMCLKAVQDGNQDQKVATVLNHLEILPASYAGAVTSARLIRGGVHVVSRGNLMLVVAPPPIK